ncbi:MAG: hypothetical protein QM739_11990 [Propionivibrio sp.]
MEDSNEIERVRRSVVNAMQLLTDLVTAAGAAGVESLALANLEQAHQLARCIAAFTTDDALADEMEEIVDESPAFLVSKVMSVRHGLDKFIGEHAALEEKVWKLVYAGRREKLRVMQVLARRRVL